MFDTDPTSDDVYSDDADDSGSANDNAFNLNSLSIDNAYGQSLSQIKAKLRRHF